MVFFVVVPRNEEHVEKLEGYGLGGANCCPHDSLEAGFVSMKNLDDFSIWIICGSKWAVG